MQEDGGVTFLAIDIEGTLVIQSGLTHLFLGGPSPAVGASGYKQFLGSLDNVRYWHCAPLEGPCARVIVGAVAVECDADCSGAGSGGLRARV